MRFVHHGLSGTSLLQFLEVIEQWARWCISHLPMLLGISEEHSWSGLGGAQSPMTCLQHSWQIKDVSHFFFFFFAIDWYNMSFARFHNLIF